MYRVRATGGGGDSVASNTTGTDTNPAATNSLTAAATSPTGVALTWTDASLQATHYVVARSSDGGQTFSIVATLDASANSYNDTVSEGGSYQYEVRAAQTLGDTVTTLLSDWTAPQSVATPPAAPSDVHAFSDSATEVDVTWTNHSTAATGITVYRSTDGQNWTSLHAVAPSQSSYQDMTVASGTQYYYQIGPTARVANRCPATPPW